MSTSSDLPGTLTSNNASFITSGDMPNFFATHIAAKELYTLNLPGIPTFILSFLSVIFTLKSTYEFVIVISFAKTFANLINHNVFITDSIDVLSKITDNEVYKKLIFDTAKNLTKGDSISKAFKDHWAFPNIAYQMLLTGERTGRLGPMMERVSDYYQEQHRTLINQMKALIEPVMIVTLAVIVGGILLAVIIPMYGMYDAL